MLELLNHEKDHKRHARISAALANKDAAAPRINAAHAKEVTAAAAAVQSIARFSAAAGKKLSNKHGICSDEKLSPLINAVCTAFFLGASQIDLLEALRQHVQPVLAQAAAHAHLVVQHAPTNTHAEEWLSRLAVLAYHVLLVQTFYGTRLPRTAQECCALVGMQEACTMLQAHGILSRQPERFLEGLIVLQLCGHPTSQLLLDWHKQMTTAPSLGGKPIFPSVLQRVCTDPDPLQRAQASSGPINSARQIADVLHFDIVLLMYAAAADTLIELARVSPQSIASSLRARAAASAAGQLAASSEEQEEEE